MTRGLQRRCRHIKADGTRCRAVARGESDSCFFHDSETADQRKAAQRAGGIKRSKAAAVLSPDTPDVPLKTVHDVVRLLGASLNQVRRGEIDPRVSNAVGYLAGILLKAMEQSDVEKRLCGLEATVASQPADVAAGSVFAEDVGTEGDELLRAG
ncbi:MAG: hypothetical protein ABII12_12140 [Planctomycetota bacterium]|nr:hypothetical protein [Planctomycetota bacterium]